MDRLLPQQGINPLGRSEPSPWGSSLRPAPSDAAQPEAGPILLDLMLQPHRSLPPLGFSVLMVILGAVSFAAGVFFVSLGAWPIVGFFGLDVALVYVAFRLNYRSARQSERVTLAGDTLTILRTGIRGEVRHWRFHPFWMRVVFQEWQGERNRLTLASHGRRLQIGGFLNSDDRRELAAVLKDALARYRQS